MAFTTSGIIVHIGNTEEIPYRDKVFKKRELVLDCSKRNQFTGQVEFPNFPKFEFAGNHVDDLNNYQIGQIVTVSFDLSGRRVEKDGNVSYFTNIQGFKIELYARYSQQKSALQPQRVAQESVQTAEQAVKNTSVPTNDFPPAVDENGIPIGEKKDDLPF